jgi:hypothetical protein
MNRSCLLDDETTLDSDHVHVRGEVCDRDLITPNTSRMEGKLESSLVTVDLRFEIHDILDKFRSQAQNIEAQGHYLHLGRRQH